MFEPFVPALLTEIFLNKTLSNQTFLMMSCWEEVAYEQAAVTLQVNSHSPAISTTVWNDQWCFQPSLHFDKSMEPQVLTEHWHIGMHVAYISFDVRGVDSVNLTDPVASQRHCALTCLRSCSRKTPWLQRTFREMNGHSVKCQVTWVRHPGRQLKVIYDFILWGVPPPPPPPQTQSHSGSVWSAEQHLHELEGKNPEQLATQVRLLFKVLTAAMNLFRWRIW